MASPFGPVTSIAPAATSAPSSAPAAAPAPAPSAPAAPASRPSAPAPAPKAPTPTTTPAPLSRSQQEYRQRMMELKQTPLKPGEDPATGIVPPDADTSNVDDMEITDSRKPVTDDSADDGDAPMTDSADTSPSDDDLAVTAPEDKDEGSDSAADESTQPTAEARPGATPDGKRDYSKLHPDAAAIAKKLPNNDYTRLYPKLEALTNKAKEAERLQTELAEATKGVPKYLAEHEQAYTLTPQYQESIGTYRDASAEASHWESQLIRIAQGEPWTELRGYDKDNNPVFTEHPAPENGRIDVAAQIRVQQNLNRTENVKAQTSAQLQQMSGFYKQQVQQANDTLNEASNKLFPGFDVAKLPPEQKKHYDNVMDLIPKVHRNNPLAPWIGKMYVQHRKLLIAAKKLEEKLNASQTTKPVPALPRSSGGSGAVGGKGVIDLSDMY